jgi:hypothetical protein
MCGTMILSGAFAEAKIRRVGFAGEALVLVPALILGILNTWMVHRVGYALYQRSKRHSESEQNRRARCAYLGLGVWAIVSLFLGDGIGWVVLRTVGK